MEDNDKDEELIGKFIEKRKQENDAFVKLLQAIENKWSPPEAKEKTPGNSKPRTKGSTKKHEDE